MKENEDIEFSDFSDIGLDIDFNIDDFNLIDDDLDTRICKPKISKRALQKAKYHNALKLAEEIDLEKNARTFVIVNGSFIFGDFIEALIDKRKIKPSEIYISTLSLSENNIDSFNNIYEMSNLKNLNVLLSGYFYSHEKHNLVPYLYDTLDKENKLQIAFCDTHCKICLIKTEEEKYYVMHGSANLRSSANIEQFEFEENKELFDFNKTYMDDILEKYKTINKAVRGEKLWQVVAENGKD